MVAKNDSPDGVGMLKAMKETEVGWQKAIDKIAERAGLSKIPSIRRQSTSASAMSAFPPRADMPSVGIMSALCQKRTSARPCKFS